MMGWTPATRAASGARVACAPRRRKQTQSAKPRRRLPKISRRPHRAAAQDSSTRLTEEDSYVLGGVPCLANRLPGGPKSEQREHEIAGAGESVLEHDVLEIRAATNNAREEKPHS